MVRLAGIAGGISGRARRRKRGRIVRWSHSSRLRLLRYCLAIDWSSVGALLMVTLTYPGEAGAAFVPRDGRSVHVHLRRFLKQWARRWGTPVGLWKLEFQARGAPHLHLFLVDPVDAPLSLLRPWTSLAWWGIVGSGDEDHKRAGTQVKPWRDTPTGYAWKYLRGDGEKEYQHRVPDGFASVGRWWGLINLQPRVVTIDLDASEFVTARRLLRRWRRATTGYRLRVRRAAAGFWLFTVGELRARGLVDCVMRATRRRKAWQIISTVTCSARCGNRLCATET
jgi:hypothetical protein